MTPMVWPSGSLNSPITKPSMTSSGPSIRVPPQALRRGQRRLDVGDGDVEGDVAGIALGPLSDPTSDADPVLGDVAVARHEPVVHRVVGVDLPPEELRVERLQRSTVLTDDFEVDDRFAVVQLASGTFALFP